MKLKALGYAAKCLVTLSLLCCGFCSQAQDVRILNTPLIFGYDSTFTLYIHVRDALPLAYPVTVDSIGPLGMNNTAKVDSIVILNDTLFSARIYTGFKTPLGSEYCQVKYQNLALISGNSIWIKGTRLVMKNSTVKRGYANFHDFSAESDTTFTIKNDEIISANCYTPEGIQTPFIQIDSVQAITSNDFRARISVNDRLPYGSYKVVFIAKNLGKMVYYFVMKEPGLSQVYFTRGKSLAGLTVSDINTASLFQKGKPNMVTWSKNNQPVSSIVFDSAVASTENKLLLYGYVSEHAEFGDYQMVISNSIDTITTTFTLQKPVHSETRINKLLSKKVNRSDSAVFTFKTLYANLNLGNTTVTLLNLSDTTSVRLSDQMIDNPNQLTFSVKVKNNARAKKYYYTVTNSYDTIQFVDSFNVNKGTIAYQNLPSIPTESITTVKLKGTNTLFTQAVPSFRTTINNGGKATIDSVLVISDSILSIRIQINALGKGSLYTTFYSEIDDSINIPSVTIISPKAHLAKTSYSLGLKDSVNINVSGVQTHFNRISKIWLTTQTDSGWVDAGSLFSINNVQVSSDTSFTFWLKTNVIDQPENTTYTVNINDSLSGQLIPTGTIKISKPVIDQKGRQEIWKQPSDTLWIPINYFSGAQVSEIDSIVLRRSNGNIPLFAMKIDHWEFKRYGSVNGLLLSINMTDSMRSGDFTINIFRNKETINWTVWHDIRVLKPALISPKIGELVRDSITHHFLVFKGLFESTAWALSEKGFMTDSGFVSHDTIFFTLKPTKSGWWGLTIKTPIEQEIYAQSLVITERTGMSEVNGTYKISAYPNPVKDILTIETHEQLSSSTVTVYDVIGKEYKLLVTPCKEGYRVNLSGITSGIYSLSVPLASGVSVVRLIKE